MLRLIGTDRNVWKDCMPGRTEESTKYYAFCANQEHLSKAAGMIIDKQELEVIQYFIYL